MNEILFKILKEHQEEIARLKREVAELKKLLLEIKSRFEDDGK